MRGIIIDVQKYSVDDKGNVEKDPAVYVIDYDFKLWRIRMDPDSARLMDSIEFEGGDSVGYSDLSAAGKDNLRNAIRVIVEERKSDFLEFLNNPPQISIRMNSLELLPGVGKKTARKLLAGRPYDDVPEKLVDSFVGRVVEELAEPQKYYLFVGDKSYFSLLKKKRRNSR